MANIGIINLAKKNENGEWGIYYIPDLPFYWDNILQSDTIWLFNIAMENCPFTDDFPS